MFHIFLLEKQVLAKVFKTQDKNRIFYFWKDSWILRVCCNAIGYWHQSVLVGKNSVLEVSRKLLQGRKWWKHKYCPVSVPGVSQGIQTLSSSFLSLVHISLERIVGPVSYTYSTVPHALHRSRLIRDRMRTQGIFSTTLQILPAELLFCVIIS